MTIRFPTSPAHLLLLGGRAPACLEWARLLAKLGYQVHIADSVSPCLASYSNRVMQTHHLPPPAFAFDNWQGSLVDIVKTHHIELIIPTCEEVFYLAHACLSNTTLRQCSWIADFSTLMQLHDKFAFAKLVKRLDVSQFINVPTSILIETHHTEQLLQTLYQLFPKLKGVNLSLLTQQRYSEDIRQLLETPCNWVFKPCLSRFATRTLICPTLAQVLSALFDSDKPTLSVEQCLQRLIDLQSSSLQPHTKLQYAEPQYPKSQYIDTQWLVQQYIQGQEFASFSLAQDGALIAHTCYQASCRTRTSPTSISTSTTQQTGASLDFRCVHLPQLVGFVRRLSHSLNYTGQLGFDFIQDANGQLWLLECNPRATSGIHLLARDGQFLAKFLFKLMTPHTTHTNNLCYIQTDAPYCSLKFAIAYEMLKDIRLYRPAFTTIKQSSDVIYQKDDLRPVLGQFIASAHLLWQAWRHNKTVLEMSTHDIAWDISCDI